MVHAPGLRQDSEDFSYSLLVLALLEAVGVSVGRSLELPTMVTPSLGRLLGLSVGLSGASFCFIIVTDYAGGASDQVSGSILVRPLLCGLLFRGPFIL